jgi:hypothetical protein
VRCSYIYLCLTLSEPVHTAAAKGNRMLDFGNLRVYGLLTNLTKFQFYSYDPVGNNFYLDEDFSLETRRIHYCFGMIHGILNIGRKVGGQLTRFCL